MASPAAARERWPFRDNDQVTGDEADTPTNRIHHRHAAETSPTSGSTPVTRGLALPMDTTVPKPGAN